MSAPAEQWAIVELMGHVRMAGRVMEVERFGAKCGRIDIPQGDGFGTVFFSGASIYRVTPCTEEIARHVASSSAPPISPFDMPPRALPAPASRADVDDNVPSECRGVGCCHDGASWCSSCNEDVSDYCDRVDVCDHHKHLIDEPWCEDHEQYLRKCSHEASNG